MAFCRLVTALVLIHSIAGLLGAEVRSSIVGGQDAPRNGWPWMAFLNISDGVKEWRCGGTILSNDWVMSAASCWNKFPGANPLRSSVWVGTHELQKKSKRYMAIINLMQEPKYGRLSRGFVHDVILVKLKKKLQWSKEVKMVSLPSVDDHFDTSSECWIMGWGNVKTNEPLKDPETLQQVKISIIPQSVCKEKYPELTSDMLCAGDLAGGKDACTGDYGGPLVCRKADGFVQVGIMSYGSPDGCGLPDRPGVYTSVSKHLKFITDYVHRNEEASAEV